jgi:IclR helix-turn-helix domain
VLAAFDEGVERLSQVIVTAAECERGWRERVRAALAALLEFFDERPLWARFLILDSPVAALEVAERRQLALARLAHALERETRGIQVASQAFTPSSQLTAELVVGGVFSALHTHTAEGRPGSLHKLAPSLLAFIAASYRRATPGSGEHRHPPVRPTYRTTRVLEAIGALPRSNNREIAEAAGMRDQGQTSKLLNRLERRGLVQNVGLGAAHGEPNAWVLTASGRRVLEIGRGRWASGSDPGPHTHAVALEGRIGGAA